MNRSFLAAVLALGPAAAFCSRPAAAGAWDPEKIYGDAVSILNPSEEPQPPSGRQIAPAPPPRFIYHVGRKDLLLDDARAGNIPDKAWKENIMGTSTAFQLPPHRRGLYGAEDPLSPMYFGDKYIGEGHSPWVMRIEIKEECRLAPRVSSADELAPRVSAWLAREGKQHGIADPAAARKECLGLGSDGRGYFRDGPAYGNLREGICGRLLSAYYASADIRVVEDAEFGGSWYIRDRACIAGIRGTPDDILEMMQAPSFWKEGPEERGYAAIFVVAAEVFHESPALSPASAAAAAAAMGSDWPEERRLAQTYLDCAGRGKSTAFQAALTEFLVRATGAPIDEVENEGGATEEERSQFLDRLVKACL